MVGYPVAYRSGALKGGGASGGLSKPLRLPRNAPGYGKNLGVPSVPPGPWNSPKGAIPGMSPALWKAARRTAAVVPALRPLLTAWDLFDLFAGGYAAWLLSHAYFKGVRVPSNWEVMTPCAPGPTPLYCEGILFNTSSTSCGSTSGNCAGLAADMANPAFQWSPSSTRAQYRSVWHAAFFREYRGTSYRRIEEGDTFPEIQLQPQRVLPRPVHWPDTLPDIPYLRPVVEPLTEPKPAPGYRDIPKWRRIASGWAEVGPLPASRQRTGPARRTGAQPDPSGGQPPELPPPTSARPGRKTKERKFRARGVLAAANLVTESHDLSGCIHQALPKQYRRPVLGFRLHGKTYMPRDPGYARARQFGKRVNQTHQQMAKEIYANFDKVDWNSFEDCFLANTVEDFVFGAPDQMIRNNLREAGMGRLADRAYQVSQLVQ